MKLYATLETSRGKTVSISDNEQITATVYDGNMKALSVIIEWCIVGDSEHGKCFLCGSFTDDITECNDCGNTDEKTIEVIPAEMGAIITTREWRNREETNDKRICGHCGIKLGSHNDLIKYPHYLLK